MVVVLVLLQVVVEPDQDHVPPGATEALQPILQCAEHTLDRHPDPIREIVIELLCAH